MHTSLMPDVKDMAHRFHMWKYDMRERIHDRLFPNCRGEDYW